ncbi:unnamed protein product [Camellia sinensis]
MPQFVSLSDCIWITDDEFCFLGHDLYERFHAFNSPGSVFSSWGEMMETSGSVILKFINGVAQMLLRLKF